MTRRSSNCARPIAPSSSMRRRSGSISAEISARITEQQAFYELDAPIGRVCSKGVPTPYARHMEQAAIPSAEDVGGEAAEAQPCGES